MTLSLLAQAVSLQGQVYRVSNCLIDEAIGSVPQVSFAVEMDANSGLPVPAIGMQFAVDQICDGLYSVMGEVTSVQRRRIPGGTQYRVTGMGEGRAAGERRWLGIVPAGPLGDSVRFLWQQVVQGVDLSLVPAAGPMLPDYPMAYASVSEFMDFVSNNTGWIWSLRNGVLRVFDPMVPGGNGWPLLPVVNTDFEANSLEITEGLDIINVARQQAWFTRRVTVTAPRFPIGCRSSVPLPTGLPKEPEGWEFVGATILQGVTVDGSDPVQARITIDGDVAQLDPGFWDWPRLALRLEYRRLVWVEERDLPSIAQYGPREGPPLPHDGAMGVGGAHDNLRNYLDGVSQPSVSLTGISLRADLRPGQQIQGALLGLSGARRYLVKRVRRATSGTELEVRFDAETAGLVADPGLNPVTRPLGRSQDGRGEMVRRIENLERGPLNPASRAGFIAAIVGPVPRPRTVAGRLDWNVSVSAIDPFKQYGEADAPVNWGVTVQAENVPWNYVQALAGVTWSAEVEADGLAPVPFTVSDFLGEMAVAPVGNQASVVNAPAVWTSRVKGLSYARAEALAPAVWTASVEAANLTPPLEPGGIYYWEVEFGRTGSGDADGYCAVSDEDRIGTYNIENPVNLGQMGWRGNGTIWADNSNQGALAGSFNYGDGDILMMAYNALTGDMWVGKNGTWHRNPENEAPAFSLITRTDVQAGRLAFSVRNAGDSATLRGRVEDFDYPVPSGARPLTEGDPAVFDPDYIPTGVVLSNEGRTVTNPSTSNLTRYVVGLNPIELPIIPEGLRAYAAEYWLSAPQGELSALQSGIWIELEIDE